MNINLEYEGKQWIFKLLETGGQATPTSTHGEAPQQFESYLSVGLMTEPTNIPELFIMLSSLTANHFEGMIVSINPNVKLSSWKVQSVEDSPDGVKYTCTVGYKAFMPKDQIEYKLG